ncbi:MAG: hypothetical protein ACI8Z5_002415 [Lentimonas sp.]|jgi:hypothetical protein
MSFFSHEKLRFNMMNIATNCRGFACEARAVAGVSLVLSRFAQARPLRKELI